MCAQVINSTALVVSALSQVSCNGLADASNPAGRQAVLRAAGSLFAKTTTP